MSEHIKRLDQLFSQAFPTNHPAMHDYALLRMDMKRQNADPAALREENARITKEAEKWREVCRSIVAFDPDSDEQVFESLLEYSRNFHIMKSENARLKRLEQWARNLPTPVCEDGVLPLAAELNELDEILSALSIPAAERESVPEASQGEQASHASTRNKERQMDSIQRYLLGKNNILIEMIKQMQRTEALHDTSRRENSEAAHYRIHSFLDGTAHEYMEIPRREVLLIAKGFIECAEVSGLITLSESDNYYAQLRGIL